MPSRTLKTSAPGEQLSVSVTVEHPELGRFFAAVLNLRRSAGPQLPNESAGLRILCRYRLALSAPSHASPQLATV